MVYRNANNCDEKYEKLSQFNRMIGKARGATIGQVGGGQIRDLH